MQILPDPITFEWDKGNIDKNIIKHRVTNREAEEVFNNDPKLIVEDEKHSLSEKRFMVWGKTSNNRNLTIIFTVRKNKIRVISARDSNIKERGAYEEKIQANSQI